MSSEKKHELIPIWLSPVEKFERIVVAALALLLVIMIAFILVFVAYIFVSKVGALFTSFDNIPEIQQMALHGFSGILLVLLGLELLDTVKVYFREHSLRVEVILLVGLIAMGRQVLETDINDINPMILFGFSSPLLALAFSYFLVKWAQFPTIRFKECEQGERSKISTEKDERL